MATQGEQGLRLGDIAERVGLSVRGDAERVIHGVCTIDPGKAGHISFLANPRYRSQLAHTQAEAVVLSERDAAQFDGNALIAKDPYLAFARVARLFEPVARPLGPLRHDTAVIAEDAVLGNEVRIGPHAVIGAGARIGDGAHIGPHCVIEEDAVIGEGSHLVSGVHIGARCVLGARCHVQAGAVVGGRGFGLARGPQGWEDVPQLGRVRIGNDVEVGANTTIDRGAIDDTVIADGVKIDNLVQIAHNVQIGAHTAIAGCAAIAGSTRIGANCLIGGGVGINGHVSLCDGVIVLGFTMVTRSITEPGQYGSGWPVESARTWHGQVRRLRRLDKLEARVAQLEGHAGGSAPTGEQQGE
ncbi:MAG: UDP-3-O-(3-hydroxymyristoyl)glucosamine N-acyltransferase [Algiphilus sp.]